MKQKWLCFLIIATFLSFGVSIDARADNGISLETYLVQQQKEYKDYVALIRTEYTEFSGKEKQEYSQYILQVTTDYKAFETKTKDNYVTVESKLKDDFNQFQGSIKKDYTMVASDLSASKEGLQIYSREVNGVSGTKMLSYSNEVNGVSGTKMLSYSNEVNRVSGTKMLSYSNEVNAFSGTKMLNYSNEVSRFSGTKMLNYYNSVNKTYTGLGEAQTEIDQAKKLAQEAVVQTRSQSINELATAKKLAQDALIENAAGAQSQIKELQSSLVSVLEIRMNAYSRINEIRKIYFMAELFKPIPELDLGIDYKLPQQSTTSVPVNLEGEPALQMERYPVEQILTPPDTVIPKTDAYVLKTANPITVSTKLTIQVEPSLLQGNDPKKVAIWKFVSDIKTSSTTDKQHLVHIASLSGHWESIGGKVSDDLSSVSSYIDEYGTYAVMLSNQTIADIQGYKYQYEVEVLLAQGVISGYNENEFRPNSQISRAEFAKVVVKGAHISMGSVTSSFSDISKTHWATRYVAGAVKAGSIKGYTSISFGPSDSITREQAVAIVQRTGKLNSLSDAEITKKLAALADGNKVSAYAKRAVAETLKENMISEESGTSNAPNNKATRGVVAKMIMGLLIKLGYL